jgi:IS30 family transposase
MEEIIKQKIKEVIKKDSLDLPKRYSNLNNKRMYLYNFMRKQGMSYKDIAKEFNRTHATIINGINRYKDLTRFNDSSLKVDTECYEEMFSNTPEPKQIYNLVKDIFKAATIYDLDIIKRRLENNMYDIGLD